MKMIPKIIHYCWFGKGEKPELAFRCIESWKKFFPDYEIIEWNEDNFDVNIIPYTAGAYEAKKYAFVSDYARFWILYHYGGLYFDTDVEVIKPMNDIIERGPFMGMENDRFDFELNIEGKNTIQQRYGINPGLCLGAAAGHPLYKEIISLYNNLQFTFNTTIKKNKTVVTYTTECFLAKGYRDANEIQQIAGVFIYPPEYFCPKHPANPDCFTENTRSIHHYAATWIGQSGVKAWLKRMLGEKWTKKAIAIKHKCCSYCSSNNMNL